MKHKYKRNTRRQSLTQHLIYIQGDSVAIGPKLLSLKYYVTEITT